jgi:hypothetical protein
MAERERVHRAVKDAIDDAERLLDESPDTDLESRLMILINGWGRGLAAGLEELAIAVADLRRLDSTTAETEAPTSRAAPSFAAPPEPTEQKETTEETDLGDLDESELRDRAAESRKATAALREESKERSPSSDSRSE